MKRSLLTVVLCLLSLGSTDPYSDFDSFEASLPSPLRIQSQDVILPPTFTECWVTVTGYSSEARQTDETPFTTSSNSQVRWGILATNWLPFGAEVEIPRYFGEESFKVEDRMAMKNWHKLDIWFPETASAWEWGRKRVKVKILMNSVSSDFQCPPNQTEEIPDDMILWHGRRQITVASANLMIASAN